MESSDEYADLFMSLIADWRDKWQKPQMPFYFVQLPNHEKKEEAQDEAKHILLAKEEEAGKEAVIITNTSESDIKESLRGSENNVDDAADIIIETVL